MRLYMARFVCLLTAAVLIALASVGRGVSDRSNNVLSPRTSIKSPENRAEPLEVSVEKAIKSGFFNEIFETDEELEFVGATSVGDSHVYFTIHGIEFVENEEEEEVVQVKVSYLKKDKLGYGVESASHVFELNTYYTYFLDKNGIEPFSDGALDDLDTQIRDFVETQEKRGSLFENSTTQVVLRGKHTGEEYKIYYKFGKSTQMEIFAAKLLNQFEVNVPEIFPDGPNHVWIKHIDGVNKEVYDQEVKAEELDSEAIVFQMGKALAFLFLLGHDDFIIDNYVLTSSGSGVVIDFETIGQGRYSRLNYTLEISSQTLILLNNLFQKRLDFENFYTKKEREVLKTHIDLFWEGFKSGAKSGIEFIRTLDRTLDEVDERNFYGRVLLKDSRKYPSGSPIPHYSFRYARGELLSFVKDRYKRLKNFVWMHEYRFWTHPEKLVSALVESPPDFPLELPSLDYVEASL